LARSPRKEEVDAPTKGEAPEEKEREGGVLEEGRKEERSGLLVPMARPVSKVTPKTPRRASRE
jgi:hypothetical protein